MATRLGARPWCGLCGVLNLVGREGRISEVTIQMTRKEQSSQTGSEIRDEAGRIVPVNHPSARLTVDAIVNGEKLLVNEITRIRL